MASVTSLGLHRPAGLEYLIQEGLLPSEPAADSYSWQTTPCGGGGALGDDELLITKTCVVWSCGGIVRKSFLFEVEGEPVTQAIITNFIEKQDHTKAAKKEQVSSGQDATDSRMPKEVFPRKGSPQNLEKALVVFLRTQAHVYFLSGTSHVIHLPFEVQYALAAPNGLIIQRKLQSDKVVSSSLKLPRVPPNSFVSPQTQPWSAASSQLSTFSIASFGSSQQLPLPTPAMGELWDIPTFEEDSRWPRLFSLIDPLSELGLLVMTGQSGGNRKGAVRAVPLDSAEELIHITDRDEFTTIQPGIQDPLILAVTLNRETSMYTVWRLTYVEQADCSIQRQVSQGSVARRRSSLAPGTATGATTPVSSQYPFRESASGTGLTVAKTRREENAVEEKLDLASTLGPDFDSNNVPRRKSRRVSSMLARADLSASRERSAFSELAGHQHSSSRRVESLGSQQNRSSLGHHINLDGRAHVAGSQLGGSISSFLEAPVDELLEELKAGGDFEGFINMGIDDDEFEGLKKEVILTKIESFPTEYSNVRFSNRHKPAKSQCKIFALAAPPCAIDDPERSQIVMCILDTEEKKLHVLPLNARRHSNVAQARLSKQKVGSKIDILTVTAGEVTRAKGVLDACKLTDGDISRILVLTESADGYGELSLQAPWSLMMKIALPENLALSNIQSLSHNASLWKKTDGSFRRPFNGGPHTLRSLRNPLQRGTVDIIDEEGRHHQIRIAMESRNPLIKQVVDTCRDILPGPRGGEAILVGWWNVRHWLVSEFGTEPEVEWSALVVVLFALILGAREKGASSTCDRKRKPRGFPRSSSGAQINNESWQAMLSQEATGGGPCPTWMNNSGWSWLCADEAFTPQYSSKGFSLREQILGNAGDECKFLPRHIKLARNFVSSSLGQAAFGPSGYMPTAEDKNIEQRRKCVSDLVVGLHLLREEQKLNVASVDALGTGDASLSPVLGQILRWLGWSKWAAFYDVEDALMEGVVFESTVVLNTPQPSDLPEIYGWIKTCLITRNLVPFSTLGDTMAGRPRAGRSVGRWLSTPRIASFTRFFAKMKPESTSVDIVEALLSSGITAHVLDTLPEAVIVPLRESIVDCQAQPPVSWGKDLLKLVDREDVNMLLSPGQRKIVGYSSHLAPTHEAKTDIHTICSSNSDPENVGSFDGSAEVDRLSITRLIFRDDRRFNEAAKVFNTSKPTVARCEPDSLWSESDLLEAQKELVQTLATRTLAIPPGRGLLYYSARIPLLTEKFPIGGFNLHCVMKPTNNTVGVDKTAFTEEKVCWAFFHAGVAAGLGISHNAKIIDTSWILYNKPQELSNRHAGFLLALGLNGHLKSLAKWVAFKYLTPKHTMTSIGLLLGLAASYLGTMDSLITRLLSVHVTRMLPAGAAELNLSPLTQTTGIMGIGLLYCNTQHRRMSEIMLSEIENIEPESDEEPLRNECYRTAAGFALGLINLGKGSDLKGLHDMHLTERLLGLAVGHKKTNLVQILDKAAAAAVVAIALIFMKSEDQILARKIDIPDSILQYDYVRPDTFLLRTLARHLIVWSEIQPLPSWIEKNLPVDYRHKASLIQVDRLSSDDLPFYDIITGLCFSIALRYAGSGSVTVRDLLVHYLDQMMRIYRLPTLNYDQKLARNTVRNCQDLLALAVSTVMAGSGDLVVFRRLRVLHGRDDADITYGSHLATHLAIGALFLGGGTYTFGTSNLAIASLIIAFYPLFPTSILDNRSHLQAFRHFWVLATEARCLVTRDIDTNRPVSMPLTVSLRSGRQSINRTPCLLPDLQQILSVVTNSREYWNITLDFARNPRHLDAFKSTQTLFVRRRPVYDANRAVFHSTLQALDDTDGASRPPLEWLLDLPVFSMLTSAEKALVIPPENASASLVHAATEGTLVDARLVLEKASLDSGRRDRLQGLKLLFEWANKMQAEGREMHWIRREVIDRLNASVWMMAQDG